MPKFNASPALVPILATKQRIGEKVAQGSEKLKAPEKIAALKEHPVTVKVSEKRDLILTLVGVVLVFHGTHFARLLLCFKFVSLFCYESVTTSTLALYNDVKAAYDKMKSDNDGDEHPAADGGDNNKHAKKREAKKVAEQSKSESWEKDAAAMAKLMKSANSDKVSETAFHLVTSLLACVMVARGGLAQSVFVAHLLVTILVEKSIDLLEFPGHEDLKVWTDLMVKAGLYVVCAFLAMVAPPLVLAIVASACGVQLLAEHGLAFIRALGKSDIADKLESSKQGLMTMAGIVSFGTLWQLWSWAAGSGVAWYFKVLYLPAVCAEGLLSIM